MKFTETELPGVILVEPDVHGDERGFFLETYHHPRYAAGGIGETFVQDNHSRSKQGTLRGLHTQLENAQGKLVRVTAGAVFDAVVDMRHDSPTLGQWYGATLSAENQHMLWVPPGFAHGFYVTTDYADFMYKCTDIYHPESEVSLAWDDPDVGIEWPIPAGEQPQLSGKDAEGLPWSEAPLL